MKKFILSVGVAAMLTSTLIIGPALNPKVYAQQTTPAIYLPMVQADQTTQPEQGHNHQHVPDRFKQTDGSFAHLDLGAGEQILDTAHFRIHYTHQGENAVSAIDRNGNNLPDYVDLVAEALEFSRDESLNRFGWAEPPADGNWGGNELYDVYLADLSADGAAGYVDGGQSEAMVGDNPNTPEVVETNASFSYMAIDTTLLELESDGNDQDALNSLRSTVAHEYMHSIQFGYDADEPADWLWEATANWMMEEVYQSENVGHTELHNAYDSPDKAPHGENTDWYARWIFFRYISEQFGHNSVKAIWEAARSQDGYTAIETALSGYGTNLDEVMRGYNLALLTNGFAEEAEYPTVRLEGAVTNQFQPTDGVESMGADYVEIQGEGALTVRLESTGLEGRLVGINSGQASIFPMPDGQTTIDGSAYQHLYLIVQNLNRPATGTETNMAAYAVTVTPGGAVNAPTATASAPNFRPPVVADRSESEDDWADENRADENWENEESEGEWQHEGGWDDESWDDESWEGGSTGEGAALIAPPASLVSTQVPAGFEIVDVNDDGEGINVEYMVHAEPISGDAEEPFILITLLHEPLESLWDWGVNEITDQIESVNGVPVLIEEEDGILYATFAKDGRAYLIDTTLSLNETLDLIQGLM